MRIIPARAGFTSATARRVPGPGDHPRSRGVYTPTPDHADMAVGSSPLARGLQVAVLADLLAHRIIPARAGFTLAAVSTRSATQDHPRSRGVYGPLFCADRCFSGSSPLARGLRRSTTGTRAGPRIIPARAGFTPDPSGATGDYWDHPRSRGVYTAPATASRIPSGSSPLARGLPPHDPHLALASGIIPARAGFTLVGEGTCLSPRDHPRSRGVYLLPGESYRDGAGSSPLARGLQSIRLDRREGRRIIPARAGFTTPLSPDGRRAGDHPRSRGVYVNGVQGAVVVVGSSPLARGLRWRSVGDLGPTGIIPARAGFTVPAEAESLSERDHPRSRGVYPLGLIRASYLRGSSPLARGLPGLVRGERAHDGIIPARAGFTLISITWVLTASDHPRSRGVYMRNQRVLRWVKGSSPLARGLPADEDLHETLRRIIPARAGFTAVPTTSDQWDEGSSPLARGLRQKFLRTLGNRGIIPARAGFTQSPTKGLQSL